MLQDRGTFARLARVAYTMAMQASHPMLTAAMVVCVVASTAVASPKVDESAIESARFLLAKAVTVGQDRSFHELLRALRHLRDPALTQLFEHLAQSDRAVLQIHGTLGLAEVSPTKKVDLKRVIAISDAVAQAELISAALDDELMDIADCEQLAGSSGLEAGVRLLVANELVRRQRPVPAGLLDEAIKSDNLGRKHLAALLLVQQGDPRGSVILGDLNQLQDDARDSVRLMVLDAAIKYEFDKAGPWAMSVASEANVDPRLEGVALQAALRFGASGAEDVWLRHYQATTEPAQQIRLAILALRVSPWVGPRLYAPLKAESDPLLKQLGLAGEAIATNKDVAPAVIGLVQLHHPIANRLAMGYANDNAAPQDAKLIFLAFVLAYEQGPREARGRLLEDAIAAAQLLYQKSPDDALALLRPILTQPGADEHMVHGVLLGLLRAQEPGAHRVLTGLPTFTNPHIRNMVLMLKAKSDQPMTPAEMDELALLVRGGGRLQEPLRVQAAWAYVKRVGQERAVLASVLRG
jgi:hypothetical protein